MRKRFLLLLLLLVFLLASCVPAEKKEPPANAYVLYYPAAQMDVVAGGDALVAREVIIEGAEEMNVNELAKALLTKLLGKVPDEMVEPPVRGGVFVNDVSVAGQWAQVDFSHSYGNLTGLDLTLADYCVTLTLTQLEGINAVTITADGRTLPQRGDRPLVAADALLATTEQVRRPVTVNLYFYDEASNSLRAERRALELYEGQTRVDALLEALIAGAESGSLQAILPEDFTVLGSYVEEKTCYLNLPADVELGEKPRLAVDSLVASICSLAVVDQVQIVLDGELSEELCGVSIAAPLRANMQE